MLAVVGYSGSGKTTLLVRLIEAFCRRGLQVGTLKHDVHSFEMDRPGKDTWRHKQAGAAVTVISSPRRIGMVRDVDHDHQPHELLALFKDLDLVLLEGFKGGSQPKIEIYRSAANKPPACQGDPHLLAVSSDIPLNWGVPRFDLEDISGLADFISTHFKLSSDV